MHFFHGIQIAPDKATPAARRPVVLSITSFFPGDTGFEGCREFTP